MKCTTLLLVAVAYLASTSTVLAECAWVLWTKHEDRMFDPQVKVLPTSGLRWELMGTSRTQTECQDGKTRMWELYATECDETSCPGVEKVSKVLNDMVVHSIKVGTLKGTYSRTLYCVPDTVDPREKKE